MSTEITSEFVWHSIPPRPRDSHKGSFGTVLAVAGSAYYRGAALLAAEGALRTGAGIVTLASVEPVLAAAVARLPECCLCPCVAGAEGGISPESIPQLQRQKATVLLLGPGVPYFKASSKNPNFISVSSLVSPNALNILFCKSELLILIEPPPSSSPFITMSYAFA